MLDLCRAGTALALSKLPTAAVFRRTPWKSHLFQAEDGIRDTSVTGVQTCALPIWFTARGAWSDPFSAAGPQQNQSEQCRARQQQRRRFRYGGPTVNEERLFQLSTLSVVGIHEQAELVEVDWDLPAGMARDRPVTVGRNSLGQLE